jgi:hypothetical protein
MLRFWMVAQLQLSHVVYILFEYVILTVVENKGPKLTKHQPIQRD